MLSAPELRAVRVESVSKEGAERPGQTGLTVAVFFSPCALVLRFAQPWYELLPKGFEMLFLCEHVEHGALAHVNV